MPAPKRLAKMSLNTIKRLIRRNTKQYERIITSHSDVLDSGRDIRLNEELRELEARSFDVKVEDLVKLEVDRKLYVKDDRLEGTMKNEQVTLRHRKSERDLTDGQVSLVKPDGSICIKLNDGIKDEIKKINEGSKKNKNNNNKSKEIGERVEQETIRIKFKKDEIRRRDRFLRRALERFSRSLRDQYIINFILGNYNDATNVKYTKTRLVPHKRLARPSDSQRLAVEESMKRRISIIEGVAGSGKSIVGANIAYSSSRLRGSKIMICSPVQSSLDQLAEMLDKAGIFVVRMPPFGGDHENDPRLDCSLESQLETAIYERGYRRHAKQVAGSRLDHEAVSRSAQKLVSTASDFLKIKLSKKLLRNADVVCCSPIQAGNPLLRGINFSMLIIDDSHLISEIDCIVPLMVKGLKQVTFLSDMRQDIRLSLKSDFTENDDDEAELNPVQASDKIVLLKSRSFRSLARQRAVKIRRATDGQTIREPGQLVEKSLSTGFTAVALNYQLRMPKGLANLVNQLFFSGRMRTDTRMIESLRPPSYDCQYENVVLEWLPEQRQREHSTALFDLDKTNFLTTIDLVEDIIEKIVAEGGEDSSIGVIYNLPDTHGLDDADTGTVRDFVGLERDYIILACRPMADTSGKFIDCDYTRNDDALCTAMTRARCGLFIATRLRKEQSWIEPPVDKARLNPTPVGPGYSKRWSWLIEYYKRNNLVI